MKETRKKGFMHRIRRTRLRVRLLVVSLAITLLPVCFLGVYAFHVYTDSINKKLSESAEQSVNLMKELLEIELVRYSFYCNTLSASPVVQRILSQPRTPDQAVPPHYVNGEERSETIVDIMDSNPNQLNYLRNLRIADTQGNVVYDRGYDNITPETFHDLLRLTDGTSPRDSLYYVNTYRKMDMLVIGRKIFKYPDVSAPIGYILTFIDEKMLHDVVYSNVTFGPDSNVMLMAQDGLVISSTDTEMTGTSMMDTPLFEEIANSKTSSFHTSVNGKNTLAVFSHSDTYGCYFVATIPYSYIMSETQQITQNLIIIIAALILVGVLVSFGLYASVMQPIRNIIKRCNLIADADFDKPIGDISPDELGFLARTIDQLIVELKEMGIRWQNDQRRKRELELESLQYQINPHFLFNTLKTLKTVAHLNDVPVLENSIGALSVLLQNTLMNKDEFIPIGAEIENLRHYFSIQTLRYAGNFDTAFELDDGLSDICVPRLILQPLAENAILHGIRETGGKSEVITITVRCRKLASGDISLEVEDDGRGFVVEEAQKATSGRFSGIGISNVQERLSLYYGDGYGLQVTSCPGIGTLCTITLPAKAKQMEGGIERV